MNTYFSTYLFVSLNVFVFKIAFHKEAQVILAQKKTLIKAFLIML